MKKDEYDVIIIGAGIGGLVCGCYLAKAGMKVLIVEQHSKPGGCCGSFDRNGYKFDIGVHYLGSLRENGGILNGILNDHNLKNKINILKREISNKIIISDKIVNFSNNNNHTIEELVGYFPKEKNNILNFFKFISNNQFLSLFSKTKTLTFREFINEFFNDEKLKSIFSILVGNLGLPPSKASALASIVLFKEYILDGGYYPQDGMQSFPNLFAEKFREYGGDLFLSTRADSIIVNDNFAKGVVLNNNTKIYSKIVISNSDVYFTFTKLISSHSLEINKINNLKISSSAFVVYLGLNKLIKKSSKIDHVTWLFTSYDIEKNYNTDRYGEEKIDYIVCHIPAFTESTLAPENKSIVRLMFWVRPTSRNIKDDKKNFLYKKTIRIVKKIMPDIEKNIEIKEIATPSTFNKFTFNYKGSAFGWAATPIQIDRNVFPFFTSVNNLFLVGHWVTLGFGNSGIAQVAFCGKFVAKTILRNPRNLQK